MSEDAMRKALVHWRTTIDERPTSAEAFAAGWQAATRAAVPDGWKLVPYEPTPTMIKATGLEDDDVIADVNDLLTSAYREMLAAAPGVGK